MCRNFLKIFFRSILIIFRCIPIDFNTASLKNSSALKNSAPVLRYRVPPPFFIVVTRKGELPPFFLLFIVVTRKGELPPLFSYCPHDKRGVTSPFFFLVSSGEKKGRDLPPLFIVLRRKGEVPPLFLMSSGQKGRDHPPLF